MLEDHGNILAEKAQAFFIKLFNFNAIDLDAAAIIGLQPVETAQQSAFTGAAFTYQTVDIAVFDF